jgi:hypothetical protein
MRLCDYATLRLCDYGHSCKSKEHSLRLHIYHKIAKYSKTIKSNHYLRLTSISLSMTFPTYFIVASSAFNRLADTICFLPLHLTTATPPTTEQAGKRRLLSLYRVRSSTTTHFQIQLFLLDSFS